MYTSMLCLNISDAVIGRGWSVVDAEHATKVATEGAVGFVDGGWLVRWGAPSWPCGGDRFRRHVEAARSIRRQAGGEYCGFRGGWLFPASASALVREQYPDGPFEWSPEATRRLAQPLADAGAKPRTLAEGLLAAMAEVLKDYE